MDVTEEQFKQLWESDGFHLTEVEVKEVNDHIYKLLILNSDAQTYEYGRHGAVILKISKKDGIIVEHTTKNYQGGWLGRLSPNQDMYDWFHEHVGQ